MTGISVSPLNYDWFLAVHKADCNAVAEISYDGTTYTMNLKYYIIDYYDWDEERDVLIGSITDQEMYYLCRTGVSRFYENWGIYETIICWTNESDIQNTINFKLDSMKLESAIKLDEENRIEYGGFPHWN